MPGDEILWHARICACVSFVSYVVQFLGGLSCNSTAVLIDSTRFFADAVGYGARTVRLKEEMKGTSDKFPFGSAQVFHALTFLGMGIWCIQNILLLTEGVSRFFNPQDVAGGTMFFFAISRLMNDYALSRLSFQYHIPRFNKDRPMISTLRGESTIESDDQNIAGIDINLNPLHVPLGNPNYAGGMPVVPDVDARMRRRLTFLANVMKSYITSRGSCLLFFSFLMWTQPINLGTMGDSDVPFWDYLDGYCCVYVFLLSVVPVRETIRPAYDALMLRRPPGLYVRDIHAQLLCIPSIVTIGKLQIFSVGLEHTILAAHIVIDVDAFAPDVLKKAKKTACHFGFTRATFELTRANSSSRFHIPANFALSAVEEDADRFQRKAQLTEDGSRTIRRGTKAPSPHPPRIPPAEKTSYSRKTPSSIEMSPLVTLTADPDDPYSSGPAPGIKRRDEDFERVHTGQSYDDYDVDAMVPPIPPAIAAAMAATHMLNDGPVIHNSPRFEQDKEDDEASRGRALPCAPGKGKRKKKAHY